MILALALLIADPSLERAEGLRAQPLPACVAALNDVVPEVRSVALHCLVRHNAEDVRARLVAALSDPNEDVSGTARLLLVRYEPETAVATANTALRVDIAAELGRILLSRAVVASELRGRYHRVLTLLCDDEEAAVRGEAEQAWERVVGKY